MKRWRNKLLLIAGVSALGAAIPAIGQDTPESLLPPGFGDPEPAPKAKAKAKEDPGPATQAPEPSAGNAADPGAGAPPPPGAREDLPEITDSAAEDLRRVRPLKPLYTIDVPSAIARSTEFIGALDVGNGGLGAEAFGTSNGGFVTSLMADLEAPLPSRWASILLRRALLSRVPAPVGIDPVNFVAERAALLLRMGEADAARALVQSVDVVNFTPRMIQVALDTALATADPAALCPLIEPGRSLGDQPIWRPAEAICAALSGEAAQASALIDQARSRGNVTGADLTLAEKVVGAGTDTRRAVSVEWDEVDSLTPWRLGLAGATGMEIPERLLTGAGPRLQAWFARAPMVPVEQRLEAAAVAATLGVFSSKALVDMHSLVFEGLDPSEAGNTPAGRLRNAFAHRELGGRMQALKDLWDEGDGPARRYAQSILTAIPASAIPPSEERAEEADELIAAMLSAGLDAEAARWSEVVSGGDAAPLAWALLAVGSPRPSVDTGSSLVDAFREADESRGDRRTLVLVAALAGLDRLDGGAAARYARDLGADLGQENRWTQALDEAVRARQPGTVALLAAIGMQTGDWSGVPASHLFRIVRALRGVGLEFEARMVAAEALTRL